MKQIHKAYKFRLYPNKEQQILLNKHFGSVRFTYNHFLNLKQEQYRETKKSDGYVKQAKKLTEMKKQSDYEWLNEINSQTLQYNLQQLDDSFKRFFKGKSKFPNFKSKKSKNSFTVPQFVRLEDSRVYFPKFKDGIKIKQDREIIGKIKKATLSKTPTNKYFVSILVEQDYEPVEKTGAIIGLDLGIKDFVITSDGIKYKNQRYFKKYERQLAKAQRHLSRKKKGSNQYENQRLKIAKIHEKISNSRNDMLHKVSTQIVKENDIICLEDLNIKGMIGNRKLSKHIQDVSWGTFVIYLTYKANWNDKEIVKISRFYPSSKTCNECGWVNNNLKLSDRTWTCKNGHNLDRDINASLNILDEGLRQLTNFKTTSAGTVDYTDGEEIRLNLLSKLQRSQKPNVL